MAYAQRPTIRVQAPRPPTSARGRSPRRRSRGRLTLSDRTWVSGRLLSSMFSSLVLTSCSSTRAAADARRRAPFGVSLDSKAWWWGGCSPLRRPPQPWTTVAYGVLGARVCSLQPTPPGCFAKKLSEARGTTGSGSWRPVRLLSLPESRRPARARDS